MSTLTFSHDMARIQRAVAQCHDIVLRQSQVLNALQLHRGHRIDKITVRNVLRRHHLDPAPKRREGGMSWTQFLTLHWEVLAATDFFTVEVATWHGLVTYYVLVVMELSTRQVEIAGMPPHPNAAFMQQCARQLTGHFDGFLLGKRSLIHD